MKKLKNNKNGSFNTLMLGEIESITWKVNKAWEKYVKNPLWGMKNHGWAKGECISLFELSIMWKQKPLYSGDVLPKQSSSWNLC